MAQLLLPALARFTVKHLRRKWNRKMWKMCSLVMKEGQLYSKKAAVAKAGLKRLVQLKRYFVFGLR